MNKIIYLVLAITFGFTVSAQSKYEQGMKKAFELWDADDLDGASQLFERIAAAENEQWLPDYYVAQIEVLKCWNDFENRKEATLKTRLDRAQEFINNVKTKQPETPYLKQLQAQMYTVWVAHDGMKYGMKYAGKIAELYADALNQEPENPIFILNKAEWDMGSARYFGGDVSKYCAEIKRSIDLFATFQPETAFHPSYGLERAKEVIKECEGK